MIHRWNNPPPISLSFKLAFVVPRRCTYALTTIDPLVFFSSTGNISSGITSYSPTTTLLQMSPGPLYLGFFLPELVPSNLLALLSAILIDLLHIGQGINYWENNPHSILIL